MASKRGYVAQKNLFENAQLEEELVIPNGRKMESKQQGNQEEGQADTRFQDQRNSFLFLFCRHISVSIDPA